MELYDEDVRAILQLLDASTFDELEVETDRFRLTLRREGGAWTRETRTLGSAREMDTSSLLRTSAVDAVAASPHPRADGWLAVTTPLPGTFYRSPKPGAPAFIEVGAHVTPDTVVAIVETMKLMNSVYAGSHGRVAAISQTDGELVPQHAVLMFIEPDAA